MGGNVANKAGCNAFCGGGDGADEGGGRGGVSKEMPLKRREIWSRKGRKNEKERSAEKGRYINTQRIGGEKR